MMDFIQITNDPALARRCDELPGLRVFVDLERHGKQARQAGRNTFISSHQMDDVARIREVLTQARLMVRLNPLHEGSAAEIEQTIARGADALMLPMFRHADELAAFCALVAGRVPVSALLETRDALASLPQWVATSGLAEVFVGLNDLHLSLGCRFMFEPLADGLLEPVAQAAQARGLRFGFGGIARVDEGLLPGQDVLAEHLRLGSCAVILSRTFFRDGDLNAWAQAVQALRQSEARLQARSPVEQAQDRARIAAQIARIAAGMAGGA